MPVSLLGCFVLGVFGAKMLLLRAGAAGTWLDT
ncbi:DUF6529 family protein [Streptomyces flavidovirens]|uniref:DUF6529 family protein n=1 Tax=Streptomyces flavidovirens TaxID=67298 RepID=A0ABW6RPM2_9ACTN